MATNLAIDDSLIIEAQKLGGHATKKATVSHALMEYIQHRRQLEIVDLFGAVPFDEDYDYKKQRMLK
ncbi:MAG TPA: type II toxin-antitoxin system VapB family antitoxin [Desulfuromonadales bacterium]|nr:type II toxin-antitoxin system VapB family antitoxin [Desulfuromonadales bacterium]